VVVAAVGGDPVGPSARAADLAPHRRDTVDERDQLGDVVAVAAGERPGERDPGRVDQEMVFRAVSGSVNRARARLGAPLPEWLVAGQWAAPLGRVARGPCLTLVLDSGSATCWVMGTLAPACRPLGLLRLCRRLKAAGAWGRREQAGALTVGASADRWALAQVSMDGRFTAGGRLARAGRRRRPRGCGRRGAAACARS